MAWATLFYVAVLIAIINSQQTSPCNSRKTENGIVCVCNSTYCDEVPTLSSFETSGTYQLYTTSEETAGFQSVLGSFTNSNEESDIDILIDFTVASTNNTIFGFGGAFTDSTGYNVVSLPEDAQNHLLESYFGDNGIEYSFGRVPIGGVDFSLRYYSYCDNEDPTLENFQLQEEDNTYKIPLIKKAKEFRNGKEFKLMASVWTAPPWMKTNNNWTSGGSLKEEHYQTWANYFLRFFEEYAAQDIDFWGVTNQNEPSTGFGSILEGFTGMSWLPHQINDWIGSNLGPTIRNSNFSHLKIITHDDQRYFLPLLNWLILSNEKTLQYLDGVAVHYYGDAYVPKEWLNFARSDKKDLFIIASEACTGYFNAFGQEAPVVLGSWSRAEQLLRSIYQDLSEGVSGWIDWNMALNTEGGPLIINNAVDSPIIVNATSGEFYKQPMFYALGHFSKFVTPGSILVKSDLTNSKKSNIQALAFLRSDNIVALEIWNSEDHDVSVAIKNVEGSTLNRTVLTVKAKSLNTFLYSAK